MTIQLSARRHADRPRRRHLCAWARRPARAPLRWLVNAYIEVIRNTPFLVQIFFFFFGLPALGLRCRPTQRRCSRWWSTSAPMRPRSSAPASSRSARARSRPALALSLKRLQVFRYVVLKPALRAVYPALTSQFILLMLSSSVVSAISADDLTSVANDLQSQTFRSFEIYIVVTVIYLRCRWLFSAAVRRDLPRRLHLPGPPLRTAP